MIFEPDKCERAGVNPSDKRARNMLGLFCLNFYILKTKKLHCVPLSMVIKKNKISSLMVNEMAKFLVLSFYVMFFFESLNFQRKSCRIAKKYWDILYIALIFKIVQISLKLPSFSLSFQFNDISDH